MNITHYLSVWTALILIGCRIDNADNSITESTDTSENTQSPDSSTNVDYVSPDFNEDGSINILVLGTNTSINGGSGFSPDQLSVELNNILNGDPNISGEVNVVSEDLHTSRPVPITTCCKRLSASRLRSALTARAQVAHVANVSVGT